MVPTTNPEPCIMHNGKPKTMSLGFSSKLFFLVKMASKMAGVVACYWFTSTVCLDSQLT